MNAAQRGTGMLITKHRYVRVVIKLEEIGAHHKSIGKQLARSIRVVA